MKTQEGPHLCAYLHHHSPSDDMAHCAKVKVILHFKVKVFFVRADGLQELGDVVGIQRAGLRGHSAGQVCVADVRDALNEHSTVRKLCCRPLTLLPERVPVTGKGEVRNSASLEIYTHTHKQIHIPKGALNVPLSLFLAFRLRLRCL